MTWILFVIFVNGSQYYVQPDSVYQEMESCFARREQIVEEVGKPIINYQAVCIAVDQGNI